MSSMSQCPACSADVTVAEAALQAECPECGQRFDIEPTNISASPLFWKPTQHPVADEQHQHADRGNRTFVASIRHIDACGKWDFPLLGVRMIYWSAFAVVGWLILMLGHQLSDSLTRPSRPRFEFAAEPRRSSEPEALLLLGKILMLATPLASYVGMCLCCAAPHPSSRRRAIAAVILPWCTALMVGLSMMTSGVPIPMLRELGVNPAASPGLSRAFGLLGAFFFVCTWIAWLCFHESVGRFFNHPGLRKHSGGYLFTSLFLTATLIAAQCIVPPHASRGLGETLPFVGVALMVWYLCIAGVTIRVIKQGLPVADPIAVPTTQ